MGDAQLSSDFFDLVTFVNSFYVGSGIHSGSGFCGSGSSNTGILGGEELVGDAQLSSDFF